jgi:hypothetical protein
VASSPVTSPVARTDPSDEGHFSSHAGLLRQLPDAGAARRVPDRADFPRLVVVPASRRDARLGHAAGVARMAGCPLLVLCSRDIAARDVGQLLDQVAGPEIVLAVDVQRGFGRHEVILTTDWAEPYRDGNPRRDVAHKRNLGIALAVMLGLPSVLFLDDDVFGLTDVDKLDTMARGMGLGALRGGSVEAVGWRFLDFPDNSVVCHARRRLGRAQDSFVGGGGMQVGCTPATPFFPNVYNEDWLFLFDLLARDSVVLAGELFQGEYDPFAVPGHAARQEFGDVLGESLFALLHEAGGDRGRGVSVEALLQKALSPRWWWDRIRGRNEMIGAMVREVASHGATTEQELARRYVPQRVIESLEAAARQHTPGLPDRFAGFVASWRDDRTRWWRFLEELKPLDSGDLVEGLRRLGQSDVELVPSGLSS